MREQQLPADLSDGYLLGGPSIRLRSSSDRRVISRNSVESHPAFHARRSNVCSVSQRSAGRYGLQLSGIEATYARSPSSVAPVRGESMHNSRQFARPPSVADRTAAGRLPTDPGPARLTTASPGASLLDILLLNERTEMTPGVQTERRCMDAAPTALVGCDRLLFTIYRFAGQDRKSFQCDRSGVDFSICNVLEYHSPRVDSVLRIKVHAAFCTRRATTPAGGTHA